MALRHSRNSPGRGSDPPDRRTQRTHSRGWSPPAKQCGKGDAPARSPVPPYLNTGLYDLECGELNLVAIALLPEVLQGLLDIEPPGVPRKIGVQVPFLLALNTPPDLPFPAACLGAIAVSH